jgi:undecaprenyl-diphosphatase
MSSRAAAGPALSPLPRARRPRSRAPEIAAAGAAVAFVALAVVAHRVAYFPIDLTITRSVQSLHAAWLEMPLHALNWIGFPPVVDVLYGSVALAIFLAGKRWEAVGAAFAAVGGAGLNNLAKMIVARPRPDSSLITVEHHINNGTFPAGHVLNFTAFAGFLAYLLAARLAPSWRRTLLISVLVLLIAMMGLARIHSGEHWPSDVLGAYLLGLAWLEASIRFYEWRRRRPDVALVVREPRASAPAG